LGRFIGVVFLLPYLYFLIRKKIQKGYSFKFLIAFFLGGVQGFLGWAMVQSGLIDNPNVSHFRLAAHLLLAFFLLAYLYWLFLDLKIPERRKSNPKLFLFRVILRVFFFILLLQICYGALTAGLNAGHVYNTFPKMQGAWIPAAFFGLPTLSENLFSNVASVQFLHRVFGWFLLLGVGLVFWGARRFDLSFFQTRALKILSLLILLQFVLGVITLLSQVVIPVAVAHQVTAALIVLSVVNLEFSLRSAVASKSYGETREQT
jgi:cytochrome c oxidase assembly protein subunit 15